MWSWIDIIVSNCRWHWVRGAMGGVPAFDDLLYPKRHFGWQRHETHLITVCLRCLVCLLLLEQPLALEVRRPMSFLRRRRGRRRDARCYCWTRWRHRPASQPTATQKTKRGTLKWQCLVYVCAFYPKINNHCTIVDILLHRSILCNDYYSVVMICSKSNNLHKAILYNDYYSFLMMWSKNSNNHCTIFNILLHKSILYNDYYSFLMIWSKNNNNHCTISNFLVHHTILEDFGSNC